jgi:hypothetical protein
MEPNEELEPLKLNINIIKVNGKPAIQFHRTFSLIDSNKEFIQKIMSYAFNGKKITANIEIRDKVKAFYKLQEIGLQVVVEPLKN